MPEIKFYSRIDNFTNNSFVNRLKEFDSVYFFSLEGIICRDQVEEAFRRSGINTGRRIKERGALFLCLLSGERRIEEAILKSGLKSNTVKFGAIADSKDKILALESTLTNEVEPLNFELKQRCSKKELKIFTEMTMVDFYLQSN